MKYTIDKIKEDNLIIFEAIVGSKAYGTDLPTSDTDIKGVFIQPLDDIIVNGHINQVSDEKNDIVFYELGRFLNLIKTNNPTVMELLYTPEDCVLHMDPIFKNILDNAQKFLTTKCKDSFGGYAYQQIKKAKGYNKKINWEESNTVRKDPLDFCYIIEYHKSYPIKEYLKDDYILQKYCGVVNVPNTKGIYALFFDSYAQYAFEKLTQRERIHFLEDNDIHGYMGIVKEDEKGQIIGNDIRLSSVPKEAMGHKGLEKEFIGNFFFNKDAYSVHCKQYKEYREWIENRNPERFNVNKEHGKNYDSKNMMHTFRLLNTAIEIVKENKINVRRPKNEIKTLMKIRKGEYEYDNLVKDAESKIEKMDKLYENSDLPTQVDDTLIQDLIYYIRKNFKRV